MTVRWIVTLEYASGKLEDFVFNEANGKAARIFYDNYPEERINWKRLSREVTDVQIVEDEHMMGVVK